MASAELWNGREVLRLRRIGDILDLAHRLVGQDDQLANLLLEDALHELHGLLGDRARPFAQ